MSEFKRISVTLTSPVADQLDRRVGENGNKSAEVNRILRHWFSIMEQAKRRLDAQLSRSEKGLILDATNGSMLSDDYTAMGIYADIEDAIEVENLDEKWGVEDGEALVRKLYNLRKNPIECSALAEAITEWWGDGSHQEKDYDELLRSPDRLQPK